MTQDNQLALNLRQLLNSVADKGGSHLTEVNTDLAQTALLLTEAIEKLGSSFMSIHAVIGAQQEAIALLLDAGTAGAGQQAALQSMRLEMDRHVNAAITGLQFQDMTSQLLQRTLGHVDGVRGVLEVLGETAEKIIHEDHEGRLDILLAKANEAVAERSVHPHGTARKAVNQTHMECGDIELF
ncbi:chemotaxis protein [Actimicrobium antarcticum]|uniref:Chemotaxis protein n=1 Tax=Actimicrobium antarcticum TaxID=1051899 RepID=A0ABP7U452_9BURK